MPFTFSHAALVLPAFAAVRRRPGLARFVDPTALAMGSFAPDFEYYFRLAPQGGTWHHVIPGLLWAVPLGIALALLFQWIVKPAMYQNLPFTWQARWGDTLARGYDASFARWPALVISAAVGFFAHILWDAGTHASGLLVQAWPALLAPVDVLGIQGRVYHLLQHGSTVLGGGILAWYAWRRAGAHPIPAAQPLRRPAVYWGSIVCGWCASWAIVLAAAGRGGPGKVIVSGVACLLAAWFVASVALVAAVPRSAPGHRDRH